MLDCSAQVSIQIGNSANNLTLSGTLTSAHLSSPDLLFYLTNQPLAIVPSNTVVVLDGDSLMTGLANVLTNLDWIKSAGFASITSVAVGGTGLSDATNRWASNKATFGPQAKNGTNGLYLLWCMQGNINQDPQTMIGTLTNFLNEVASSNYNIVLFTTEPGGTDNHLNVDFFSTVNNFERSWDLPWRIVDVDQMMQANYDSRLFVDKIHMTSEGYTNVSYETIYQLWSPFRHMGAQTWVRTVGTNVAVINPAYQGYNKNLIGMFDGGGFELSSNLPPPSIPLRNGDCRFWNSNGVVYLLTSGTGLTWTSTNKLGP